MHVNVCMHVFAVCVFVCMCFNIMHLCMYVCIYKNDQHYSFWTSENPLTQQTARA